MIKFIFTNFKWFQIKAHEENINYFILITAFLFIATLDFIKWRINRGMCFKAV